MVEHKKTYIATIKLGEKTDTADAEGNIVEKKQVDKNLLNEENVKETYIYRQSDRGTLYGTPIISSISAITLSGSAEGRSILLTTGKSSSPWSTAR